MLINYWRGIIGDIGIYERYREAISRLYRGEWHGLHVERLRVNGAYIVYSMRLGKKGRLLFTSINNRLCLLEVLENHEYHRSRFLKTRGAVEAFCTCVSEDSAGCSSPGIEVSDVDESSLTSIFVRDEQDSITWRAVEAHGKHLIQLSDEQDGAVSAQLPSVVLGPAGSGKTSVLLSSMLRYVREHAMREESFPVVYVCQSSGLAEKMSCLWQGMVDDELLRSRVVFKTVDGLYQEHYPSQRLANDEQRFLQWYQEKLSVTERLGIQAPALYEEFRVCCGYEQAAYVRLGARESRVPPEKRASCYALYQRYLSYLQSYDEYSSVLGCVVSTREAAPRYRMAFWDEAQVLSLAQLRWLESIVPAGQFMACFGEHQALHDGVSRYEYLKKLCHQLNTRLEEHTLSGTFRCSSAVTLVLNQLLAIKFAALGGSQDKHESPLVESSASMVGSAVLLSQQSVDLAAYVNRETVDFAVVTNQAHVEEVRRRFKTALVFTPEEIQGLEFSVVLVYRPLDNEVARKINARLGDELPMVGHAHRPKVMDASASELEKFMNRLVTMSSRAVQDVVIVQDSEHATKKIYACLKKVMSDSAREAMSDANAVSSEAQWLEQAAKLVAHGLLAQARTIVTKILKKSQQDFDVWLKSCMPATTTQSVPATAAAAVISAPTPKKKPPVVQATLSQEPGSAVLATTGNVQYARIQQKISVLPRTTNVIQANQLSLDERLVQAVLANYTPQRLNGLLKAKTAAFLFDSSLSLEGDTNKPLIDYLRKTSERERILFGCVVNNPDIFSEVVIRRRLLSGNFSPKLEELGRCMSAIDENLTSITMLPVHFAVKNGSNQLLTSLWQLGADVNVIIEGVGSLAHLAVRKSNESILSTLKLCGASLACHVGGMGTPAHVALRQSNVKLLRLLKTLGVDFLASSDPSQYDSVVTTAIERNQIDIIKHFIRWHIDFTKDPSLMLATARVGNIELLKIMCSQGLDVNFQDRYMQETAACIAASRGDLPFMQALHELGAKLTLGERPPWMLAALENHVDVLDFLCKNNAVMHAHDVAVMQRDYLILLQAAIERDNVALFSRLRVWFPRMCDDISSVRAIFSVAMRFRKFACFQVLHRENRIQGEHWMHLIQVALEHDAVALILPYATEWQSIPLPDRSAILFLAAQYGSDVILAHMTTVLGVDINMADSRGQTIAMIAVQEKNMRFLRVIETLGFSAWNAAETAMGHTAAYMASELDNLEMLEFLSQCGADINQALRNGITPLQSAALRGSLQLVKKFYELGVDFSQLHATCIPCPVETAATRSHVDIVKYFCTHGVDVNTIGPTGVTLACIAADTGNLTLLNELVLLGADCAKEGNIYGMAPALYAIFKGHIPILERLYELNALPDNNTQGLSLMLLATIKQHTTVISWLEQKGYLSYNPNIINPKVLLLFLVQSYPNIPENLILEWIDRCSKREEKVVVFCHELADFLKRSLSVLPLRTALRDGQPSFFGNHSADNEVNIHTLSFDEFCSSEGQKNLVEKLLRQ